MNDFFGTFEKWILASVLFIFGLIFYMNHSFPEIFHPELKQIHQSPNGIIKKKVREGQVIPVSGYSAQLSNPFKIYSDLNQNLPQIIQDPHYDPTQINLFAQDKERKKHPANAFLTSFKPFDTDKSWIPLLAISMSVRYMRDDLIIPNHDVWQTAPETYLEKWGDCEDHAILLADWLISLGYDARVVAGRAKGEGHAWVVLFKDGKEYLLESTDKASRRRYPLMKLHPEYEPFYMFNQDHFWALIPENSGRQIRKNTKKQWVILSDFIEKSE